MRRESITMKHCTIMYRNLRIERDTVLHKTKLLLKIYRPVVWSTKRKANEICEEAVIYSGKEVIEALDYLVNYTTEYVQDQLINNVDSLFETKWLITLIEHAMNKIYDYPDNGKMYHQILCKQYLTSRRYSETEILEELNMERSSYYDKKKEAIELLSICLWGYTVPAMKGLFASNQTLVDVPQFFANVNEKVYS